MSIERQKWMRDITEKISRALVLLHVELPKRKKLKRTPRQGETQLLGHQYIQPGGYIYSRGRGDGQEPTKEDKMEA